MSGQPSKLALALNRAITSYQAGQLGEAEKICRKIISTKSNFFDAHYVLAVVQASQGKNDLALSIIKNSIAQIAVFLYPVLVLVSLVFATHLTFAVSAILIGGLALTAIAVWQITGDGEAAAFEGWALVGLYVILATLFFFE